jgi:hypothetical protein
MSGAIPQTPQYVFMVRCLVKHRGKFTFPFKFRKTTCVVGFFSTCGELFYTQAVETTTSLCHFVKPVLSTNSVNRNANRDLDNNTHGYRFNKKRVLIR